jgi:hypothetical protein
MFFEPAPPDAETAPARPELPPWAGPPTMETGVLLAVQQIVARSANVAVFLPAVRVFSTGCMLEVEIVSRQADLSEEDWFPLHLAVHSGRGFHGARLPDRLLRLGVRFPDGSKATTLDQHPPKRDEGPPDGPLMMWWPGGSGGMRHGGGNVGFNRFGLWLWPLPPAANFEFAVEWPLAGIELTFAELDGAAIVAAAGRPAYYWPEPPGTE